MSDIQVEDNLGASRYEASRDGELAGFAEYRLADGVITFTHTEIESAFEGQGIGSALVRSALDDVRGRELRVVPLCPFVKGWIGKHPDYADLLD